MVWAPFGSRPQALSFWLVGRRVVGGIGNWRRRVDDHGAWPLAACQPIQEISVF